MDERKFWPLFVLAAFFFTSTGFPVKASLYGIIDPRGIIFVAMALQFVMLCGIAYALKQGMIDLRRALCFAIGGMLCCIALSEPGAIPIRWLLPLPMVAMVAWPGEAPEQTGWLATLPRPALEALAIICAVLGAGILSSGLDYFRFSERSFDYFEIFLGGSIYAAGLAILLTGLDRRTFVHIVQGAYVLCLALLSLVLIVRAATATMVITQTFTNLIVCAMLLFRAWQLFLRPDGWLKMIETGIGGILVSLSLSYMVDFGDAWGPWALIGLPLLAIAAAVCFAGLWIVWSDEIWLRRFRARASR